VITTTTARNVLALVVLASSVGCELAQPFEGPGFSLGEGLTTEAPGPFLAATTHLTLKDGAGVQQRFDALMSTMSDALPETTGLVGVSLAQGTEGYRTLTVWEDEAAMLGWVTSPAHTDAMAAAPDLIDEGKTTHWTMTRDELLAGPPSWDDAKARLEAQDESAY
jgi:heme-degrading monooxygenase HmoA